MQSSSPSSEDRHPVPCPTLDTVFLFLEVSLCGVISRGIRGICRWFLEVFARERRRQRKYIQERYSPASPQLPRGPAPCGRLGLVVGYRNTTTKSLVFHTGLASP